MGKDLCERYTEAREIFARADEALGESLSTVCFEGPEEALKLTRNTQPALLTVSIAAWSVISKRVPPPVVAAGHSLGEFSAHVAAGTLEFEAAVRAVRLRGDAMQRAVPVGVGAMVALLGANAETIEQQCDSLRRPDEVLAPANFNSRDQIVVAGHESAVKRLIEQSAAFGIKRAIPLPVSAPFHCRLMDPAANELENHLATIVFRDPSFPIVANVDAEPVLQGEQARERLVRQVSSPVRWVSSMERIVRSFEPRLALEVGAGRVLAGLARKIDDGLRVLPCGAPEEIDAAQAAIEGETR